ncbi:MOSC domain-containing protein [Actinomadura sp. 9N407]|uniref:MOSC domain-containing protein n=1 Tax=Actinomadura sp. 9N407 TaxID=3375154 RepID=UPI00379D5797
MRAVVAELVAYPVKGCAGVPMTEARLTEAGLAHDRAFMVVTGDGTFRSQRRDPRLALVRPAVGQDGRRLTLRAPGLERLDVEIDTASARCDVELFGMPYQGIDQGPDAAEWLSEILGAPSRLVRVPPEHDRVTDGATPGTSGYADSSPVHVISRASLDGLNRRLEEAGSPPLPMDRFRPNIVIAGWAEPHLEDGIRRARIGTAELGFAKLAIRCAVTTVDQRRGAKAGPEPLRTLATYRRAGTGGESGGVGESGAGGVAFGAKFSVLSPGKFAVGDEMDVRAWAR